MNKQPTTEHVTRTYLSFRPVSSGQVTSACAHEEDPKQREWTRVGQRSSFAIVPSTGPRQKPSRGVGILRSPVSLPRNPGGGRDCYPSPPSFWSNICPRKNKSLLSLTTGRASLVSNRALFNRRRITDPESIQAPSSLSLSLFLALLSLLPSLLSSSWCFFRESPLSCPVPLALWVCPPLKVLGSR